MGLLILSFFLIEVLLIYNVVLVSGVQQSDSIIYIYRYRYILFFIFFSIIGNYKIWNTVPCAIQQVLVVYLFYTLWCVSVNPKLLVYPSPHFPPLVTISCFQCM